MSMERIKILAAITEREYGKELKAYATGGLAPAIISHCQHEITLDADMVLKGLNIIYKNNIQ